MDDADVLLHVLAPMNAVTERAPRLMLIQKLGVGVDTIDLEAARRRGIAVCNMPGTNTPAVAELTLLLMLATLRRLTELDQQTRAGRDGRWMPGCWITSASSATARSGSWLSAQWADA